MKPDDVRVMSPFMGGGFGSGLRPQYQVALAVLAARALRALGAAGSDPAADVRARLSPGHDRAARARRETPAARSTRSSTRRSRSRRNTKISPATTPPGRASSTKAPNAKYVHRLARLDLPTPCDMRAPGATTGVYALECAMDELAVALKLDPLELRLRCYSDRDQNEDKPYTSKELRECYRQGAEAFGWDKRNPEPRSMRDGSELVGWGMATGIWEALQMEIAVRIVLTANGHAEVASRDLRHRHRHLYDHGAGRGRHARPAARQYHCQAWRLDAAAISGRRRLMDRGLGVACDRQRPPTRSARSCCGSPRRCRIRRSPSAKLEDTALIDGKLVDKTRRPIAPCDRRRHAPWRRRPHRARRQRPISRTTSNTRRTRIPRCSPR